MKYTFREYQRSQILRGHLNLGGENPRGEKIEVNSLYLERNGSPWIGVMGEFHFVRCPRDRWYEELCKMKAGGIRVVASYLFWIYHEETEGEFDFSGQLDVRAFVEEAARAGLEVVLRIGPWAHGECRNGGFPDWLSAKPYPLRQDHPDYLEKVRIWYTHIYREVQGLLYQDGGVILGIQLENELVDQAEHLRTLKRIAQEVGFTVPLYTVTGWNNRYGARIPVEEVLPVFGAYPAAPWTQHREPLPPDPHYVFGQGRNDSAIGADVINGRDADGWRLPYERYPFATCELGGGIQVTHHRRPLIRGMDIYALSLVCLGNGNNFIGYYMYHGGTNRIGRYSTLQESRASGYPNDYPILSYDFQAPLSEYGEAREHYGLLNLLHLFVEDFGAVLAPMEPVKSLAHVSSEDTGSLRYGMRTDGRSGFVFVNHYQRLARLERVEHVEIEACGVAFPPMTVDGEISFFLPFRMDLGDICLECATAQPLCRLGKVYFFVKVPGIEAEYRFADGERLVAGEQKGEESCGKAAGRNGEESCGKTAGRFNEIRKGSVTIVTLSWEDGCHLRRLSGKVVIGEQCDLFEMDGRIRSIQPGSFAYWEWMEGDLACRQRPGEDSAYRKRPQGGFVYREVQRDFEQAGLSLQPLEEAPFAPAYPEELQLGGPRKLTWKKLTVTGAQGFVEIADVFDAAQIYADGQLVADQYYIGRPWRLPAALLYGKECFLVYSQWKDDFYREF